MVTIGMHRDLGLSPTNTALCYDESQGKHKLSSNTSTGTQFGIFVVLGFFQMGLMCPIIFTFVVGIDFPALSQLSEGTAAIKCAGSPWVKWFPPFQILCRPDLYLTVFV